MPFPEPFFRWRPHPWHGLEAGPSAPEIVHAYIEITPFDRVKYELDKKTGYLIVDRPNRTSAFSPTLYGFIPKTFCGKRVQALLPGAQAGDGDPLDICVISERPITNPEVILKARVVGGLPMLDSEEADDKIIGVLANDAMWGDVHDVAHLPKVLVDRLRHYFSTYKSLTPEEAATVRIDKAYGREHALSVVQAAMADYVEEFGD
ncbi:MAG: inorganic pyrophosphatase [Planctomycetota bacterium]